MGRRAGVAGQGGRGRLGLVISMNPLPVPSFHISHIHSLLTLILRGVGHRMERGVRQTPPNLACLICWIVRGDMELGRLREVVRAGKWDTALEGGGGGREGEGADG
ncbi:hypothetical protein PoB_000092800 [Plakobranchus ocellatus]|uniref:Uncharacterized protein n=1 Tax=Plakobranchus ocellatus TaxID=259542 RepID=A0AAV3XWR0_9GAST|nr:hypothetical protein PoB_000092800 [Plakobranchus ocellatus]